MTKTEAGMNKTVKTLLYAVALFGIALTIVTELSHHYPWIMELCGGESSGCADVASTPYSKMFGISVAYWGLLSYVAFIFMMIYYPPLTLPTAAALLGAELYFMWVMSSVIHVYCLFCLIQFFTVVILFILTVAWRWKAEKFFLPGRMWSVPVVTIIVALALIIPVKLRTPQAPTGMGELVTYEGDPGARLKIEVFSDYQCPHCAKIEPEIAKIRENHPGALIVYRDYIIRSHKISPVAVSYATAIALTQGRETYVKVREEMFENQEKLYEFLKPRLEEVEFTEDIKRRIREKVDADMARAAQHGIYQTPSIVIYHGDKIAQIISGFRSYDKFAGFLKI